ncbi:MAG: peptide chain release factor N(5)-glutamine methyltransferase [Rhizobiales bacterium]|nr:peptide chain release factor N(5)-glutamine methyltransferase [Hyphomicrobiales bacterium]
MRETDVAAGGAGCDQAASALEGWARSLMAAATPPTLERTLAALRSELARVAVDAPAFEARQLLAEATGLEPARLIAASAEPLAEPAAGRLEMMLTRRLAGEPLSRILGRRAFMGLDLRITADVLDPRADSETLIVAADELVRTGRLSAPRRILDLGTGSGALALALLELFPDAVATAVDISAPALAVAAGNAVRHDLARRIAFVAGSWFDALGDPVADARGYDLIVANPPYIASREMVELAVAVRDHDPSVALDGGPDGLAAYRAIVSRIGRHLSPDGAALFEFGQGQGDLVESIVLAAGLAIMPRGAPTHHDLAGIERLLVIIRTACCRNQLE